MTAASSNSSPDPITRSGSVLDTSTSFGPANALTRAPMCTPISELRTAAECGLRICCVPRPLPVLVRVHGEDVCNSAVKWRLDAYLPAELDHTARQPWHLQSVTALEVVMHRGRHVGRNPVDEIQSL